MATKIKIITASDFMEVTPDGIVDINTSRQLLVDIAKADPPRQTMSCSLISVIRSPICPYSMCMNLQRNLSGMAIPFAGKWLFLFSRGSILITLVSSRRARTTVVFQLMPTRTMKKPCAGFSQRKINQTTMSRLTRRVQAMVNNRD